jgi:hypothetical protein
MTPLAITTRHANAITIGGCDLSIPNNPCIHVLCERALELDKILSNRTYLNMTEGFEKQMAEGFLRGCPQ